MGNVKSHTSLFGLQYSWTVKYHVILERIIRGNNINKYLLVALPKIFDLVTVVFRYFCFPTKHGFKKRKWVHFKP